LTAIKHPFLNQNIPVIIIKKGSFDLIYCVNATFSNISVISWRPVLVVEEAGVPGENH
jgi:hypothetical protein